MNSIIHKSHERVLLMTAVLALSAIPAVSQIRSGNSYINITKRAVGGTVEPGDTLEIRTNYYIPSGFNGNNLYSVRYLDNIPTNTTYIGDSLRLITNEGLTYKRWTNNAGDDAASYIASPAAGEYNIRINIGSGVGVPANNTLANLTGAGHVRPNVDRPRVGGGLLITTAFRVRVTGNIGDVITLGAGLLRYRTSTSGSATHVSIPATQYRILISRNDPICSDATGKNFVAEAGGTFDSGTTQNRSYGPSFMIPSYTYRTLTPTTEIGDGFYAIVNNLSRTASTFQDAQKRPNCTITSGPHACANRMFSGHWDIIGDHTGSTTPAGNPPAAVGSDGGYMLVVNADYATSEAYRQSITGLCPNTSYEFSLWVRNVCTNCGIDSTGTATWRPGVLPNLTFAIDDLDRYSSGQVDTVGWIKKGFLFKTGPTQTDITISIRNNASGGGGNDWAIDDIALVTCNPSLNIVPSGNSSVCAGNAVDVATTVRAFFDNYTSYRWERSIDGGNTWSVTQTGTGSPALIDNAYQYVSALPTFIADSSSHLNQYRFIVASSPDNLAVEDCAFAASTVITLTVNSCDVLINTRLSDFKGRRSGALNELWWTGENESEHTLYEIERSVGNSGFRKIGELKPYLSPGGRSQYTYFDKEPIRGRASYRIRVSENGKINLSKTVLLGSQENSYIRLLENPVRNEMRVIVDAARPGQALIRVIDIYGKVVLQKSAAVIEGENLVVIQGTERLPAGQYILSMKAGDETLNRKFIKK